MVRMLFMLSVDWNWIKQRPHFLIEELAKKYDLTAVYRYRYVRKGYQNRDKGGLDIRGIYTIPKLDKMFGYSKINAKLVRLYIKWLLKNRKTQIVFLTYPDEVYYLPNSFRGWVVYDCMDDHVSFCSAQMKNRITDRERQLCQRADLVLCSSQNLIDKLTWRYGENVKKKTALVRNGYDGEIINYEKINAAKRISEIFTCCYFGTISKWFDFELLLQSIKRNNKIYYYLYGPIDNVSIPESDHIIYMGTIEHDMLYRETRKYDCYIMPFILNGIVESVDPVKLYEYINFNKNILCVQYDEIKRFSEFVFFYNNIDSYMDSIDALIKENELKYTFEQRQRFLEHNSWADRAELISQMCAEKCRHIRDI